MKSPTCFRRRFSDAEIRRGLLEWNARRQALERTWVTRGEVVALGTLSSCWGTTVPALELAVRRGDVVGVRIDGQTYVPMALLEMSEATATVVCRELDGLPAAARHEFLTVPHSALDGHTVALYLTVGKPEIAMQRVKRLAAVWGRCVYPEA